MLNGSKAKVLRVKAIKTAIKNVLKFLVMKILRIFQIIDGLLMKKMISIL